MRLILASNSPRRADLLRSAGYLFDVVAAEVDESIRSGESPEAYVRRLAAEKSFRAAAALDRRAAAEAAEQGPPVREEAVILGADTTVVVDGAILGKPRDDEDGRDMLRRLSGRAHQVMTGVSIRRGAYEVGRVETTVVIVCALTEEEIAWYVDSGEGHDKAGGYAIQGLASRFIPRIEGSYSNVVGLPVACLAELLPEIRHLNR